MKSTISIYVYANPLVGLHHWRLINHFCSRGRAGFSGHQDEEVAEEPDDTLHRHRAQPSRLHHRRLQWRRPSHHHRFGGLTTRIASHPTSRQWSVHYIYLSYD